MPLQILALKQQLLFFFFFCAREEVDNLGSSCVCNQFGFGTLNRIIKLLLLLCGLSSVEGFRAGEAMFLPKLEHYHS